MTTPLVRPLSREILVAGTAYKVTLHADQLTLTPKGHRKGLEVMWDELLASRESGLPARAATRSSDLPRPIAGDLAREVRAATEALARARAVLEQVAGLPAALFEEMKSDPMHGRIEEHDDWFVEPLLTIAEVASILRVSTRAVRRLPLSTLSIGAEARYRQSNIREYLKRQESMPLKRSRL